MKSTTNYQLVNQELIDKADITQISGNWDKIDTEMKRLSDEKFDKTGGTITGATTATGGLDVSGGVDTDTLSTTGNATVGGKLTSNGQIIAKGGIDLSGRLLTDSGNVIASQMNFTKGEFPTTTQYAYWSIFDKNGLGVDANRLARFQFSMANNGTAAIGMYVNRPNDAASEDTLGILAQWVNGTTPRISLTHNPETSSNDKSVATTYWVKSLTASTTQYGLVRLASESDVLNETDKTVMDVPLAYELNDFRRLNTAYAVGDKVNCAFRFEYYLECTQAGTTSNQSLDTRKVTFGQTITDGTCKWIVRAHIKSVNNAVPDANGNITLSIPTPTIASEKEAKTGTDNTKFMTPLRTKQAIDALAAITLKVW